MSRAPATDVIETKATNNVYTVLVIVAFVAEVIAFAALYLTATKIFAENSKSLFG